MTLEENKVLQSIAYDVLRLEELLCGKECKTQINNEEAFKEWFRQQTHDGGKTYTENTQSNYIGAVKNASNKLKDKLGGYDSIFNVNNTIELNRIIQEVIEKDELLPELLAYGANALMPCLKLYAKFLEEKNKFEICYKTTVKNKFPEYSLNQIIFGAPGTGKSYKVEVNCKEILANGGSYERVTFHPDYTYASFVGTYKPVPKKDEQNKEYGITYEYVPGPFMRMLVHSLLNPHQPHVLIIEEINRANVAAVFGDVFQLLDRDADGVSEYAVQTSQDMRNHLIEMLGVAEEDVKSIKIPNNLFIWATMNSADQGVYPMDTAFKRRWDFEYLRIDNGANDLSKKVFNVGEYKINWNILRKAINNQLTAKGINEDKLMGPYFISDNVIKNADDKKFKRVFSNKVIMYLFEDAIRRNPQYVFDATGKDSKDVKYKRYSELCDEFEAKGIDIFVKEIRDEYNEEYRKEYPVTFSNEDVSQA